MTDVTGRDRERAALALNYGPDERVSPMDQEYVDQIAAALAEERAKARAPFLRLASEFGSWPSARILSPHDAGDRIRRAAEETA